MTRSLFRLFLAFVAAAAVVPASATSATIVGNPLAITSDDSTGGLGVAFRGSSSNEFCCGGVSAEGLPTATRAGFVVTIADSAGSFGPRQSSMDVVSPPVVTGTGVAADPFKLRTTYQASVSGLPRFQIVQELRYVNGSPEFTARYDVVNITTDPLRFRASMGADLYGGGSDRGVGLLVGGPPRFVAGVNKSSGAVAGLVEVTPWSHFEEGQFSNVLSRADSDPADNTPLLDTVTPEEIDNGAAVQWDAYTGAGLGGNSSAAFEVKWRFVRAFDLSPDNVQATSGVPVTLSTQVAGTDGAPSAGRRVRYTIAGSNPMTGNVTTAANGTATIEYVPANPGFDTVTAFPDLNGNGVQDPEEPQQVTNVSIGGPQAPVIGKTVNVAPVEGVVKVKLPARLPKGYQAKTAWAQAAQTRFTTLTAAQQIPVGSTMDVSRGRLQLASSTKGTATSSTIQSSSFSPCPSNSRIVTKGCENLTTQRLTRFPSTESNSFILSQSTKSRGLTEMVMTGALACPSKSKVVPAARKRSRSLWGNGRGRFRTRGRASSATVRGTEWYSKDTCRGTETRVTRGSVVVRDFGKNKNVTVKQGKKYFAVYKAKRK